MEGLNRTCGGPEGLSRWVVVRPEVLDLRFTA